MISKETIESFAEYACHIVIAFFPGLFILDGIYRKGLFAGSVNTIYDFIFILIWGFVMSLPFQMMTIFIDAALLLPENKRKGRYASMIELPYCAFLAFITYIMFRIFDKYKPFSTDVIGVPTKHMWFLTALLLVLLISWPIARLYRLILVKLRLTLTEP